MASRTQSLQKDKDSNSLNESDPEAAQNSNRVLMPRGYYDEKHPWFGSQIHYTIDVFRQLIRDARDR